MKHRKRFSLATTFLVMQMGILGAVQARECANSPAVNLTSISAEEVKNDSVRMNWQVELEDANSADAMRQVNHSIQSALKTLKSDPEIQNVVTNVSAYPIYSRDREISHWRASGTLRFELPLDALERKKEVRFKNDLVLRGIDYFASKKLRNESRARLVNAAMVDFQEKATLVATGFNHTDYELAKISLNEGNQSPRRPMPVMRAMSASSESAMALGDVAASGGKSTVSVSVKGTVCLK